MGIIYNIKLFTKLVSRNMVTMNDKFKDNAEGSSATTVIEGTNEPRASSRTIECKNKIRRRELFRKLKSEKKKDKRKRQDARKKTAKALGDDAPPKLVPKTIDSMREYDETTVVKSNNHQTTSKKVDSTNEITDDKERVITAKEEDEEVNWDLSN